MWQFLYGRTRVSDLTWIRPLPKTNTVEYTITAVPENSGSKIKLRYDEFTIGQQKVYTINLRTADDRNFRSDCKITVRFGKFTHTSTRRTPECPTRSSSSGTSSQFNHISRALSWPTLGPRTMSKKTTLDFSASMGSEPSLRTEQPFYMRLLSFCLAIITTGTYRFKISSKLRHTS